MRNFSQIVKIKAAFAAMLIGALGFGVADRPAAAQASNIAGAIQGTITDPSNATVPNAGVTIKSLSTNQTVDLKTDNAGYYASGPLTPGNYEVRVAVPGFSAVEATTVVQIGVVTNGSYKLSVGAATQTVQIMANAVQVDVDQSSVQNVLTKSQIENLPVQGRNFLDLAQLEPGVQLQSGQDFDPTKAGYSAISIGGVSGRTTRILLDGQDISDETVGTTIFNVPSGGISEFQLNRSNSDVSGEITSSGSVTVATPSGTNGFHGQLFYQFQDHRVGFANTAGGVDAPFQRNQFGGFVGGPLIKDKLFFFADSERIKQDSSSPAQLPAAFAAIEAKYPVIPSPFRDTYTVGRLDYNGPWGMHFFARATYEVNSDASNFGKGYSVYANRDNTPGIAGGVDWGSGHLTHSARVSYEKFHNLISDMSGSGVYNAIPGLEFYFVSTTFFSGPNYLAPQQTYQSDKQFRYDGSWYKGTHTVRYGVAVNRILGGGLANFFGLAPRVRLTNGSLVSGDPSNPLNYAPKQVVLGNGEGFFTEVPAFGYPAGGQGDWRTAEYIADTWKIRPNFTLNYGIRLSRDTGRSDSDLPPLPCSTINPAAIGYPAPCSGNQLILDQFAPGLGDRVHQPFLNWGPQLGFVYSPGISGKTAIRAGVGLFYENFVFNNVLFDRPFRLQKGLFNAEQIICNGTNTVTFPDGTSTDVTALCKEPIGQSASTFIALQKQYQATTAAAGPQGNPGYVGNTLTVSSPSEGYDGYAPHQFKTPRSLHFNFGVQQQLAPGMVLTADYLHQGTWDVEQAIDVNHVGDARFFDPVAGAAAIAATLAQFNATSVDGAIANGATIFDFAGNGLDSGNALTGGFPAPGSIAFPGRNPKVGQGFFQYPSGRSSYDALQVELRAQKPHPFWGVANSNLEVSYNYSLFVMNSFSPASTNGGSDQFFTPGVYDFNHPTAFFGPGGLDRRHQLSFGGFLTLGQGSYMKHWSNGPQLGFIAHFYSALPTDLTLDNSAGEGGQIFQTDVTGDGQTGDLVTGTNPGAYMRQYKGGGVNKLINTYNALHANTLTPAGQTVVNSGLMTTAQLIALGGAQQPIAPAPSNAYQNGDFKSLDASFSYPIRLAFISETAALVPTVAMYNIANFANFGGPTGQLTQVANLPANGVAGNTGFINGPSSFEDRNQYRTARGSGTFNQGGPRTTEFQLKFNF